LDLGPDYYILKSVPACFAVIVVFFLISEFASSILDLELPVPILVHILIRLLDPVLESLVSNLGVATKESSTDPIFLAKSQGSEP
jgi:hypothetical protein